jgi:quercetin dioxygenase-like cupin family protein
MRYLVLAAAAALATVSIAATAAEPDAAERTGYASLPSRVVLDNARVVVKAYTIAPGQATGPHAHPAPELLVFVKGGVLKSEADGRSVLWRDGRVAWFDGSSDADPGAINAGDTPIEVREVILKPYVAARGHSPDQGHLAYPNIPLEDLFENSHVIVQRFVINPGEWEGVHAHHANTLYVYIKGGRYVSETAHPSTREEGDTPDGYVGWMPAIDIAAGHQSGNIGSAPSDVVWIALKD